MKQSVFVIGNMDCPTEEALIRKRLASVPGVGELAFNLMERRLTVDHTLPDEQPILGALREIGMQAGPAAAQPGACTRCEADGAPAVPAKTWALMAVSGIAAIGAEILAWSGAAEASAPVIALALISIVTGGLGTLKKGWIALKTFTLNINFLMSVAVIGAVAIGEWPEAAVVIFLFALAELIETLSLERARNAIRGLMAMAPETATVRLDSGEWVERPAAEVGVGQFVRVKPGERIPLDGVVTAGASAVNQAPITGESMPVEKAPGDPVFAGTVNERGSFEFRVTANKGSTTLDRIIHAVESAQGSARRRSASSTSSPGSTRRRVRRRLLLVAIVPPLFFDGAWMDWIYKALVLLVIACPCALVISTPVTIVSGLAAAARKGILVKGGVYLEEGRKLKATLALDKTGTITHGQGRPDGLHGAGRGGRPTSCCISWPPVSPHARIIRCSLAIAAWRLKSRAALLEVADFAAIPGRGAKGRHGGSYLYNSATTAWSRNSGCLRPRSKRRWSAWSARARRRWCWPPEPNRAGDLRRRRHAARRRAAEAIARSACAGRQDADAHRRQPATARAIASAGRHRRRPGNLLPEDKLACESLRAPEATAGRHGRRRHQRCAGAGPCGHRLRHGRGRYRHRHRDGRRGADGRRPAQDPRLRARCRRHCCSADAEHRSRTRRQGGVLRV
jgi:Cd2+/Zn2+-exporting ATPase